MNMPATRVRPVVRDDRGTIRFKENKIVRDIVDNAANMLARNELHKPGLDLNRIISAYNCGKYSQEDVEEFWQMMGYSLSGYAELSFISNETVAEAERQAQTAFDLHEPVSCRGQGCLIHGSLEDEGES